MGEENNKLVPYGANSLKVPNQIAYVSNEFTQQTGIRKSNRFVMQKLLYYFVSKIDRDNTEIPLLIFDIRELCVAVGWNPLYSSNRIDLLTIIDEMTSIATAGFSVSTEDGWSMRLPWLTHVMRKGQYKIALQLNNQLAPYFVQLKRGFTQIDTVITYSLSGQHQITLYELAKSIEYLSEAYFSLARLLEIFGLNGSSYRFANIEKRILEPGCSELNKKTDIEISYTPVRNGRKVSGVIIHVKKSNTQLDKTAYEDWLNDLAIYRLSDEEIEREMQSAMQLKQGMGKVLPIARKPEALTESIDESDLSEDEWSVF